MPLYYVPDAIFVISVVVGMVGIVHCDNTLKKKNFITIRVCRKYVFIAKRFININIKIFKIKLVSINLKFHETHLSVINFWILKVLTNIYFNKNSFSSRYRNCRHCYCFKRRN